ncbi:MAG TPA: response regulator transcription factor [Terriglobales bacterium]|nr:response regulator transcription factor [Terriglobales bacterium]
MSAQASAQSEKAVTVLVADENRMACQLLTSSLQRNSNFRVLGCASSMSEVLGLLKQEEAQVTIISANLQDGPLSGFELLRELRTSHPHTRTILLLDSSERDLVVDAFRGGARGIFCRSQSFKMLCKCIVCVSQGQIWANNGELQFLLEALGQVAPLHIVNAKGKSLLSKREEQVVACVAEGLTNREIAKQLGLSEHTVKNYLFRIFDKLGISGRVELVLYALSHRDPEAADAAASPLKPARKSPARESRQEPRGTLVVD